MENLERPKRGFASLTPEQRREIARRGGKTAHEKGRAHRFTSEEARAAGRKGGLASTLKRAQNAAGQQPIPVGQTEPSQSPNKAA